jgi:ADP-dependent NAD(P)H-hydrate dehydratase / NAD(P)H-hydrate epimerase
VESRKLWPKRVGACLLIVLALGIVGSGVLVGAALLYFRPLVERMVTSGAESHGVTLTFRKLDYGWGWITLDGVDFRLKGVRGLAGQADRVTVNLDFLTPKEILADGVRINAEAPAVTLALELAQWFQRYVLSLKTRLGARNLSVAWRERAGSPAWVDIRSGTLLPTASGVTFKAPSAVIAGVRVPEFGAGWDVNDNYLDLGLGDQVASRAPVRLVVHHALPEPAVEITMRPMLLERLAQPFGVPLPVQGVTVSGAARLLLPSGGKTGPITGNLGIKLTGWVPPHPMELDGFVFGNETTFDTRLSIAPDYRVVTLTESKVAAGAFRLAGSGSITRYDGYARILLDLRGDIPCAALANAIAQSYLGRALGQLAGKLAELALKGSVAVLVKIDADTRALAKAKLIRTIGVGCGLRPISVPGLGEIDLGRLPFPKPGDLGLPKPGEWPFP